MESYSNSKRVPQLSDYIKHKPGYIFVKPHKTGVQNRSVTKPSQHVTGQARLEFKKKKVTGVL